MREKIIWLKGHGGPRSSEGVLKERCRRYGQMVALGIPRERILERYTQKEYDRAMG